MMTRPEEREQCDVLVRPERGKSQGQNFSLTEIFEINFLVVTADRRKGVTIFGTFTKKNDHRECIFFMNPTGASWSSAELYETPVFALACV